MRQTRPVRRRPLVLAACMAAMFMAAIEATIVATAMPTIVADLGGFSLFGWVFAAYLLTQAVTIPIYGRLADLYGRKAMFFVGAGVFLFGSALCGFAPSMLLLILFRAIQGLGAGAILPLAMTIVGDIYTPVERARIQGWLSSVWGLSAIGGPLLGAFIVAHASWSLAFWINLPVGVGAMLLLGFCLDESREPRRHPLDIAGAVLLVLAVGSLMLALLKAGELGGWLAPVLAGSALAFGLLLRQELRAAEPLLPLALWRDRTLRAGNLGGLVLGAVMMGGTAFLPTYVQGVMGGSVLSAGASVGAMSVGWPLAAIVAARLMLVTSFRTTVTIGALLLVGGSLTLLLLEPDSGFAWAMLGSLLIGAGLGMSNNTFIVSVQVAAGPAMRGVATASIVFMRMLGSSVGTALLGGILNHELARRLPGIEDPVQRLMEAGARTTLPAAEIERLTGAIGDGIHLVFWASAAMSLAAFAVARMMPAIRPGAPSGPAEPVRAEPRAV